MGLRVLRTAEPGGPRLARPGLVQHAEHVAAKDLRDVRVLVTVGDEPPRGVGHRLRRALHALDVSNERVLHSLLYPREGEGGIAADHGVAIGQRFAQRRDSS